MQRRHHVLRWSLVALLALAVGLGVPWLVKQRQAMVRTQAALRASQQMAFSGFLTQIENMEVLLAKTLASTARDRQIMLLSRISAEADGAGLNLAQLPSAGHNLGVAQKFLKQVSGYTQILAQQMAGGRPLTTQQRDTLASLHNMAGQMAQALHTSGTPGVTSSGSPGTARAQANQPPAASIEGAPTPEVLRSWLETAARQLESYPGLVYDGPFSEHLEQLKPRPLPGSPINASQAADIARSFFSFGPDVRTQGVTSITGPVSAYSVRLRPPGNREIIVDVSQAGGHVLMMLDARVRGRPTVDRPQALRTATDFLASRGFPAVVVTGWLQEGDQLTFSFAPLARLDGTLVGPGSSPQVDPSAPPPPGLVAIYPQTVKVRVSLDTGRIAGLDAVAYWQNSGVRKLPVPRLSREQVAALVNPGVKVESVGLALIPVGADREVLTYETRIDMGGDRFLIYYNAETGKEEALFQLQEAETVRLAM